MLRQWSVLARYPDFRRLFVGNTVSLLGSNVTTVALPLTAVVYLHASPTQLGILGAVAFVPHLVLGLPAGVWVDRLPYRRVLVVADIAQMLLLGAIPVLAAFGVLRIWQLYVVIVLAGVGGLFESVTAQSFTPSLVPRAQLMQANSAIMQSNATVNTSGAALGGLLVQVFTAPFAIAVDAFSFLLGALCKARIRTARPPVSAAVRNKTNLWSDVFTGLRAVFGNPIMRMVTITATIGALAGRMQTVLLVLYLVRDLSLGSGLVGLAIAIAGVAGIVGALIVTPVTERIGPGPAFISGMLLQGLAGLVLTIASGPMPLALAILAVAQLLGGAAPPLYGVNQQTFRQTLLPRELISRVNATWRFLVYGTMPIGALLGGVLGSVLGLRLTLLISAVGMLLGTAVAAISPLRSLRELPSCQPPAQTGDEKPAAA